MPPAVVGSGRRLLYHSGWPVGLRLTGHEGTSTGMLLLQYETAGTTEVGESEGVNAFV